MSSPYTNGSIREQEIASRNHARQEISRMLALEATRAAVMVAYVIGRIQQQLQAPKSPEALWNDIVNSAQLVPVRRKADQNVSDYPQFSGWVNGQRQQIERTQTQRLRELMEPLDFQRRLRNCARLQELHLVSPARILA
jgi:hypothetical protein